MDPAAQDRARRLLTAVVAILLVLSVLALGEVGDEAEPAERAAPTTTLATVPAAAPTTTAPPATAASPPAPRSPSSTAFQARARAVAFEGGLRADRVRLNGAESVEVSGTVTDGAGASHGDGTVEATGASILLEGTGLALRGRALFRRGQASATGRHSLEVGGSLTLAAPTLRFTPRRTGPDDRRAPANLRGPVRVATSFAATAEMGDARLTELPPTVALAMGDGRATLSWAGGGSVIVPGTAPFTGTWLGVKADRLTGQLRLADLELTGEARVQQVYVDGTPRLRAAQVGVDAVAPPNPVPAGARGQFTWAPRNRSEVDMAIVRIGPATPQAAWVNLALDPLPVMWGGEDRPPVGGDTSGLGKRGGAFGGPAAPIDAVILPGTADRSDVSFDVPRDTPPGRYSLALRFEGNFDPVTFRVTVEVTPPAR